MKNFCISMVILFSVIMIGDARTEDMVTVHFAGAKIDQYYKEDYVNMMIFLRWSREIVKSEQNNGVHLMVGPEGCRVEWKDAGGSVIKRINFNTFEGEYGDE